LLQGDIPTHEKSERREVVNDEASFFSGKIVSRRRPIRRGQAVAALLILSTATRGGKKVHRVRAQKTKKDGKGSMWSLRRDHRKSATINQRAKYCLRREGRKKKGPFFYRKDLIDAYEKRGKQKRCASGAGKCSQCASLTMKSWAKEG